MTEAAIKFPTIYASERFQKRGLLNYYRYGMCNGGCAKDIAARVQWYMCKYFGNEEEPPSKLPSGGHKIPKHVGIKDSEAGKDWLQNSKLTLSLLRI